MHIILTHEQADFDALAALFGASTLFAEALPVLPRKMNRNVKSFITLYGSDFPFWDPRDIPQTTIDKVTLVDTQSLVTFKGMSSQTEIQVFDHHPVKKNILPEWNVTLSETGANTTFFVERLQELGEPLTMIQATLLVIGIYEDTGSLSYSATTPRDIRAAAWLLDQGASLQIASEFLNPPLSSNQREIFDRLVASAETMDIHGHKVILVSSEIIDTNEEISTLAHKLRDLFEPDALFVLVTTNEGVRLVARSTSDDIDVSKVAAKFKGGGHSRASAALIHPEQGYEGQEFLRQTKRSLIDILPSIIRPAMTVNQIMSRRPHLLSPETSTQDALSLMQKYGYEGFPVVDKGRVVGLLTRRIVDRAINHKLNLPAASLMEAGEVYVVPDESLQNLQSLMTSTGWGQIPVIDPKTGNIIGIVTRTDLLKKLSMDSSLSNRKHLAEKLKGSLHPEKVKIIKAVADEASLGHLPVYIVGGFVRDFLLDKPTMDFDFVVEGDAISLARTLSQKYGGKITSHSRFGTAKWFLSKEFLENPKSQNDERGRLPQFVDLISARQEFYEHPSALPIVERGSIKLDLHRRDFTINTLAIRLDGKHLGELHDYFGGVLDLEKGLIRVLHSLSFVDDPTRMLRAVRYEKRYGFSIESRTLQLMDEARPLLARLSGERLRHEIDLILDESKCSEMLARLNDLGLLTWIVKDMHWNNSVQTMLKKADSASISSGWQIKPLTSSIPIDRSLRYLIWLSLLAQESLKELQSRLHLSAALNKALISSIKLIAELPSLKKAKPSFWVERLEGIPSLVLYSVYLLTNENSIKEYVFKWRKIQPYSDGSILKKKGLSPGPAYQSILTEIRAAWVDGKVTTRQQELLLLEKLIKKYSKIGTGK